MIQYIKYGAIIAAAIAVANFITLDLIGVENDLVARYSGFIPIIIMAIGLFVSMRKIKLEIYKNDLNFGQAMYSGVVIAAFAALFLSIYNFGYFQYFSTGYADKIIALEKAKMIADKVSSADIEKYISQIRSRYIPMNQLTGTFVFMLIVGLPFAAIFSAILRTKDTFTQILKDKK